MRRLGYLWHLVQFAFKSNPLFYLGIVVSLVSVATELLAMSSLFPLFSLISGGKVPSGGIIVKGLHYFGFAVEAGTLLWVFVLLLAFRIITQLASQSLSAYLGRRVLAQLTSQAFQQIIRTLPIRDIGERSIGFYTSIAGDEAFRASTLVISLAQFVSTGALSLLYFYAIVLYSVNTALAILLFMFLASVVLYQVAKVSHRLGARQVGESRGAATVFLDGLNNLKTVRSFSAEEYVVGIHRRMMFGYTRTLFWVDEIALLSRLIPVFLLLMVFSGWLLLGANTITSVDLAFIVTMVVYLMRFFPTAGQAVNLLMKIVSDARSGRDVTEIIKRVPEAPKDTVRHLAKIDSIDLRDVGFSYSGDASENILSRVSFKLEGGKTYALVGRSGIGKSTLVDILLKFFPPTQGGVYLNGQSIAHLSDADIRNRVILIGQEAAVFDDTVTNNISMGMSATSAQVRRACELACIDDVIDGMPEGYETRLQYQGKNLSGGQRQRIAIARALLRNPEVLILDESTSALDKPTQEKVVQNILKLHSDKIIIFVTHDPYITQHVDEVLNLEVINASASRAPEAECDTDE